MPTGVRPFPFLDHRSQLRSGRLSQGFLLSARLGTCVPNLASH